MDKDGMRIDEEDMEFIVIEDDRLPLLKNVSGGKVFSLSFFSFSRTWHSFILPPSIPPSLPSLPMLVLKPFIAHSLEIEVNWYKLCIFII